MRPTGCFNAGYASGLMLCGRQTDPVSCPCQDGFYQEMSLNDPGTGGFCGGVQAGDSRFSAGGLFAKGQVVKTYTAGETIPIKVCLLSCRAIAPRCGFETCCAPRPCILRHTTMMQIQIWTNHWGYFQLRLCPLSSSSTSAEKAELTEACLNKHALPLSGGQGSKYWIYKVGFRLLAGGSFPSGAPAAAPACAMQLTTASFMC